MLEILMLLATGMGHSGDDLSTGLELTPMGNGQVMEQLINVSDGGPVLAAFPEFSYAMTDCMAYVKGADAAVFDTHGTSTGTSGAIGVAYGGGSGPSAYQVIASDIDGKRTCGGSGNASPGAADLTSDEAHAYFNSQNLVPIEFPEPSLVWANCGAGSADLMVMTVPSSGDTVVLNISGSEPAAQIYCDTFGVKE